MVKNVKITTRLRDKTLELLKSRPEELTLSKIAKDTKLGEGWLSMFLNNNISHPSVNMVQALYEYLTKTEIKI